MNVDDLEAFIDEAIRQAQRKGYHPTAFQSMRSRHGTITAIEKLVQSGEVQSGFKRLKALGLLKWSIGMQNQGKDGAYLMLNFGPDCDDLGHQRRQLWPLI